MIYNQKILRTLYKKLLALYPRTFREQFGESIEQTFNDLRNEWQLHSKPRLFSFVLWMFIETTIGIIKERVQLIAQRNTIKTRRKAMEVRVASVLVNDQDKALRFYTEKLGFVQKADMADGDSPLRWLTVVSKEGAESVELELQATHFPSARAYQKDQFDAGYAFAVLHTKDIHAEFNRLTKLGVVFHGEPTDVGPVITVKFEDTCGNLINLIQPNT